MHKIKSCYSQSLGFWYGRLSPIISNSGLVYSLEPRPATYNCGVEHQVVGGGALTGFGTNPNASIPISENFNWESFGAHKMDMPSGEEVPLELFNPPPPPPTCDSDEEYACNINGGIWSSEYCFCEFQ